jgi:AcrR family transcriptional regulator
MGVVSPPSSAEPAAGATNQRQHIIDTALSLMAQRGVDGTSMRDLATASGLNVASLYHYFNSKRDLLVAVLEDRGYIENVAATGPTLTQEPQAVLADLLADMLGSMLDVEDFIRLMMGEVMRGEETAYGVGVELFAATQESLEQWLGEHQPDLCEGVGAAATARMLRALLVGLFFEHLAGVLEDDGDPKATLRARAVEAAAVLRATL